MDQARASISATLAEIQASHKALGLSVDPDDFYEAMGVVARIEQKLATNIDGDRRWSPKRG